MKNILITGGVGFIGPHVALKLADKGYEVTVLDNLSPQIHGEDPQEHLPAIPQHPRPRALPARQRNRPERLAGGPSTDNMPLSIRPPKPELGSRCTRSRNTLPLISAAPR